MTINHLLSLKIPGDNGTSVSVLAPSGIPSGVSIHTLGTNIIQVMMIAGILIALGYFAYGGFYWIQSKGNKETLDKARRIILYSIIGIIIMSLALVVVNLVSSAFGVDTLINGVQGQ